MAVRVGCSGWSYDDWREPVYEGAPARTWLRRYASRFSTVEINSTFYRLPRRSAAAGWAEQTPDGFCFAVKVSRYLTHIRRLTGVAEGLELLLSRIQPLVETGKLGPLLWQLPATFTRDDDRLGAALAELPGDLRHCVEFRHPSWFAPEVIDLLRGHGVALVVGDHPQRPFQSTERTAAWTYLRFHHGHAAGAGTTPIASSTGGRAGSAPGREAATSTRTSITTGKRSPYGTLRGSLDWSRRGRPRPRKRLGPGLAGPRPRRTDVVGEHPEEQAHHQMVDTQFTDAWTLD